MSAWVDCWGWLCIADLMREKAKSCWHFVMHHQSESLPNGTSWSAVVVVYPLTGVNKIDIIYFYVFLNIFSLLGISVMIWEADLHILILPVSPVSCCIYRMCQKNHCIYMICRLYSTEMFPLMPSAEGHWGLPYLGFPVPTCLYFLSFFSGTDLNQCALFPPFLFLIIAEE